MRSNKTDKEGVKRHKSELQKVRWGDKRIVSTDIHGSCEEW